MNKPSLAIVGPGNLGSALARSLHEAGYEIRELIARSATSSRAKVRRLASETGARLSSVQRPILDADVIWFCVPDDHIAVSANTLSTIADWKGKTAIHSSGALSSSELQALKSRGAAVGSAHPLMTFVTKVRPPLRGVPFALEGDARAVRVALRMVRDLGGEPFTIRAANKPAYHAWGGFTSPLLVSVLTTAEQVAAKAGISANEARRRMMPIVRQTLTSYLEQGPADAFSGPIKRGDVVTIQKHLAVLKSLPDARQVYVALTCAAVRSLPAKNKNSLRRILGK